MLYDGASRVLPVLGWSGLALRVLWGDFKVSSELVEVVVVGELLGVVRIYGVEVCGAVSSVKDIDASMTSALFFNEFLRQ